MEFCNGAASLTEKLSKCADYKPWHINWIVRDGRGYSAWEPDNTCIYKGTDLNEACKALNNSTYDG